MLQNPQIYHKFCQWSSRKFKNGRAFKDCRHWQLFTDQQEAGRGLLLQGQGCVAQRSQEGSRHEDYQEVQHQRRLRGEELGKGGAHSVKIESPQRGSIVRGGAEHGHLHLNHGILSRRLRLRPRSGTWKIEREGCTPVFSPNGNRTALHS